MGDIDQQRRAAVKILQELGLIWSQGAWQKVPRATLLLRPTPCTPYWCAGPTSSRAAWRARLKRPS